jgi:hypothetical protein
VNNNKEEQIAAISVLRHRVQINGIAGRSEHYSHAQECRLSSRKSMSEHSIRVPAPSGRWGMIRYSLCVLISAIALAFALDNLVWFTLRVSENMRPAMLVDHWTFWRTVPGFLSLTVAVIAWRFRKGTN